MINFLTSNGKLIASIYIVLTIIKLFTANIYSQREEDPTIYFKSHPTISNTFVGSDKAIDFFNSKYSWYENHRYWEIFHSNNIHAVAYIYDIIILSWWVSSAGLIVLAIFKLLKP